MAMAVLKAYLESLSYTVELFDLNAHFFHMLKEYRPSWQRRDAVFEQDLFDKMICDYPEEMERIIAHINNSSARYAGFSLFNRNLYFSIELINKIVSSKQIIVGGPEVFYGSFGNFQNIHCLLTRNIEFFVIGEGESTLADILQGKAATVSTCIEVESLDNLPFYDFSDLFVPSEGVVLPLLASRGCIAHCAFCAERLLSKRYRQHSVGYMIGQIRHLMQMHRTSTFSFQDSLWNGNLSWCEEFCDAVISEGLAIHWDCQMLIRSGMDVAFFKKMKRAGCFNIFFGLESGSDTVLRLMKKPFRADEAGRVFTSAYQAGLHYEASLIIGYPGEGEQEFMETCSFLRHNRSVIKKIAQINPYIKLAPIRPNQPTEDPVRTQKRIRAILELLDSEGIRYTNAFINNLVDHSDELLALYE